MVSRFEIGKLVQNPMFDSKTERPRELRFIFLFGEKVSFLCFFGTLDWGRRKKLPRG